MTSNAATELNHLIDSEMERIKKLRRELELAEAKLRGIQIARDHLNAGSGSKSVRDYKSSVNSNVSMKAYRGGRQKGAISGAWRRILSDLYYLNVDWFSAEDVSGVAAKHGVSIKPKSARDRMADYITSQFVEANPETGGFWRVTKFAANKFGFTKDLTRDSGLYSEKSHLHEVQESPIEGDSPSIFE